MLEIIVLGKCIRDYKKYGKPYFHNITLSIKTSSNNNGTVSISQTIDAPAM